MDTDSDFLYNASNCDFMDSQDTLDELEFTRCDDMLKSFYGKTPSGGYKIKIPKHFISTIAEEKIKQMELEVKPADAEDGKDFFRRPIFFGRPSFFWFGRPISLWRSKKKGGRPKKGFGRPNKKMDVQKSFGRPKKSF